jgi:hypothetical protein
MAFVTVHKDLNRIKSRIAFGMSKKQLICFGAAAAAGVPAYIFTRGALGSSAAALLMIGIMLPFFFFAMYEKDEQPAEIILRNYVRACIFWSGIRQYKTENLYEIIEKEGKIGAIQSKTTAKTIGIKRPSGKTESGGSKKIRKK